MLQKNHHFLFPQTYFGSLDEIEEALFDEVEEEEEEAVSHVPWILVLEPDKMQFEAKIGLYIHWVDHTRL